MRILACGGRDYTDVDTIVNVLDDLDLDLRDADGTLYEPVTLVHGDARGADRIAARIAAALGWEVEAYPADWNRYGPAAGPLRNQQMLDTGIDLVIAFPGGKGTADMVGRARRAGVRVDEVDNG
jgi:hypothetical protein